MTTIDTMDWVEHVGYLRDTFINGLVARGYRLTREKSVGALSDATLTNKHVTVTLNASFPYLPPDVTATGDVPRSWHREPDGKLCLYASRDRERLPWLDPDNLTARIDDWFTKNEQGWPDDPPTLDLEAYLDLPVDGRLIVYSDTGLLDGDYIRLAGDAHMLRIAGPGKAAKKSTKGHVTGYVTDIGELTQPLFTWTEIVEATDDSTKIRSAIQRGRLEVLLVRYRRQDQHGVIGLTFKHGAQGVPQAHRSLVASADPMTLALRAGTTYNDLKELNVYLIGAGALGSHIADGLVRSGIGRLIIRDGDRLLPGNTTRHLVSIPSYYGINKAQAVTDLLRERPYNCADIDFIGKNLTDPSDVLAIFADAHLVIDATADGAVTAMLTDAAHADGHRLLSTCIQNEGRTQRVDVIPPLDGAPALSATIPRSPTATEAFESGCGEPVSATPPHAVAEAAAMTVRHAIGHLTGTPPHPAGELRELL